MSGVPAALARRVDATLLPDRGRVITKLFLPGEENPESRSRARAVVARVLALPDAESEQLAARLVRDFTGRHHNYAATLRSHASMISPQYDDAPSLTAARAVLIGASFTNEYAVEAAALCNPSAVLHPDQTGTVPGQARLAVSVRGIGEGHLSSVGFCSALVGPGATWSFEPRLMPIVAGTSTPAHWCKQHLRSVLADQNRIDGLAHHVLVILPDIFTEADLEIALADAHHDLVANPVGQSTAQLLRQVVTSAYEVIFPAELELSQQVLFPSTAEESCGLEDARFVRFVEDDGTIEYRGTYTAYDGQRIGPRLVTSPDLRTFQTKRLAGPAARNKGMALFPRLVGGEHLALCRSDGESNSIARSEDGVVWSAPEPIHAPKASWEVLQVGNCGPPIETDRGWLVLTHGVGPMRTYAIGALLLDLDCPTRVLGHLTYPLLEPNIDEQEGYVPNVVYSCGAAVHDGRLWVPYGIGDARIGVAWVGVDELVDELLDPPESPATWANTSA